ncbi:glucosaminidase domain-containing protein [Peribacillus frigoritolerans]
MSKETFIKGNAPFAQKIQQEYKILSSVVIAQACLESVYGTSLLANKGKNIYSVQKVILRVSLSSFKQWNMSTVFPSKYGTNLENIHLGKKFFEILPIYM